MTWWKSFNLVVAREVFRQDHSKCTHLSGTQWP